MQFVLETIRQVAAIGLRFPFDFSIAESNPQELLDQAMKDARMKLDGFNLIKL